MSKLYLVEVSMDVMREEVEADSEDEAIALAEEDYWEAVSRGDIEWEGKVIEVLESNI